MESPLIERTNDETNSTDGTFSEGRYHVLRVLGEGAQKVVYLVHDTVLDRDCALALMRQQTVRDGAFEQLRQEALLVRKLANNPHVINVYDVGEENGTPFLVSEYAEDGDLQREIRANANGLQIERVVTIASGIAQALTAAHDAGIVHGDVTPANVWLSPSAGAQLGDFGLSATHQGPQRGATNLVGTAAYMAPEQALGQPWNFKIDLYALGVVMYEMATGRQPFEGGDPAFVVSQHISTAPVAPSWYRPEIPEALESIILSLLEKLPEDRPASCSAVIESLGGITAYPPPSETTTGEPQPIERLAAGVFVGRNHEQAELHATVDAALAGKRQVVFVAGEPGIGKTRLMAQLATYGKLRGGSVHRGRCVESDAAPAFGPWIDILHAIADGLDDEDLREDIGDGCAQIARLLPVVDSRLGSDAMPKPELTRASLFEAIASWLRRSAKRVPLVLVIEDLHWADETSVVFLQHLADAIDDASVVLAATYRDADLDPNGALRTMLAALSEDPAARHIKLHGLERSEVESYIELATRREFPHELAAAIYGKTDGNPLFMTEILRMLVATKTIDGEEALWERDLPPGVGGVINSRLERLSAECQRTLTAASVIGREFEAIVLNRVLASSRSTVRDDLIEAMNAQLVELASDGMESEQRFMFSHALVRDALYGRLDQVQRQSMHARTGEALEEMVTGDPGSRINALAFHFREANYEDSTKAVDYSIRAGDAARRIFAFEEAVRQWDAAIELLRGIGRAGEQARLLQRASDVMFVSGVGYARGIEYAERSLNVWEQIGDRTQQGIAHFRLGRHFTTYQEVIDLPRAKKHLEACIELLSAEPLTAALGYAYTGLAAVQDRALLTEDGAESARLAHAVGVELQHNQLFALATELQGTFLIKRGYLREGAAKQDEAWDLADRIDDALVGFYCAWDRAYRRIHYLADPREGIRLLLRELEKPRMAEAVIQRKQLTKHLAQAYLVCGDLKSLRACVENSDVNSLIHTFEGFSEDVIRGALGSQVEARAAGNHLEEGESSRTVGTALSRMGKLGNGIEALTHSAQVFDGQDVGAALCARVLLCIAEAEHGRLDDAKKHLAQCEEVVAGGEEWFGQMGLIELGRAATLASTGAASEIDGAFAKATDTLHRFSLVWDEAEALRLWGRALAATGEPTRAMDKYRRAIDVYRRIGAGAPWIARIVREYAGADYGDASLTLGV